VAEKKKARIGIAARGGSASGNSVAARACVAGVPWRGINNQFDGAASSMFSPAHIRQAARQPNSSTRAVLFRRWCLSMRLGSRISCRRFREARLRRVLAKGSYGVRQNSVARMRRCGAALLTGFGRNSADHTPPLTLGRGHFGAERPRM
jgi:hypothetical protein